MKAISREAAQRVVAAAQRLGEIDPRALVLWIGEQVGLPISCEKLHRLTVADLKAALSGDGPLTGPNEIDAIALKEALRILWGETGDEEPPPLPDAEADGDDHSASLRVAVASNRSEELDGHFGTARRFLIYRVRRDSIRLLEVRSAADCDLADDKNAARAALIADCNLLCVQSIGGPAAAKVVRAGVHPLKFPQGGNARHLLAQLQTVFDHPPPWLAKVLSRNADPPPSLSSPGSSPPES
ncbi:MAG: dinitrogenase iron-molybdenum cofactor biosynthesis protein [Hydrogenophilus sp.]|nr:dinitrogenase iron-molybdenum cofactor biosynthesis protein [Hydrogenophilus sp.]